MRPPCQGSPTGWSGTCGIPGSRANTWLRASAHSVAFLQGEHRTPAMRAAAAALVLALQGRCHPLLDHQAVVVEQLFTAADVADRLDIDPSVVALFRLAIRLARVIDPARRVAADIGVDHVAAVVEGKVERVMRIVRIRRRAAVRFPPGDPLTAVLDDALAFADQSHRVDAPAMDARVANENLSAARCFLPVQVELAVRNELAVRPGLRLSLGLGPFLGHLS